MRPPMENEFTRQKRQLIALGLLPAPGRLGDSLYAHSCNSTAQAKKIDQARAAYLEEHGAEFIFATYSKAFFLCWPHLGQ
jgi:hypothetical protein